MQNQPLADRLRPETLDEIVGQAHLFGKNGVIRRMTEGGRITNMIFSGRPAPARRPLRALWQKQSAMDLHRLNATTASLSDVRDVIAQSKNMFGAAGTLLYLDEIQYFNRKQQQSLLEYIEDGRITLIASTTDNPYFCVYSAILSRCAVFEFKPVAAADVRRALHRGLALLNRETGRDMQIDDAALDFIAGAGGGDVRASLGVLENVYSVAKERIGEADVKKLYAHFYRQF